MKDNESNETLVTYSSEQTQLATVRDYYDKYVGFTKWETLLGTGESISFSRMLLHRVNWISDNSEWDLPSVLILNKLFHTLAFEITYFTGKHMMYRTCLLQGVETLISRSRGDAYKQFQILREVRHWCGPCISVMVKYKTWMDCQRYILIHKKNILLIHC
jgi:hypothetical protein